MSDEFYMDLAIKEAWKWQILTYPNPAVGCVITDKFGKILSIQAHKKAGFAHAELNAILTALLNFSEFKTKFEMKFENRVFLASEIYDFILNNHNYLLENATAYVTLEPCSHIGKTPPCANLLKELKFKRVVISIKDSSDIAGGGAEILQKAGVEVKFGVLKDKGDELIEPFLAWQNGNFSFLKLGSSINGILKGGLITNKASRKKVHEIREVLDLLVIGGNTVRVDRPRIDTRLASGKNPPDVLIYSKERSFDTKIPLFSVKNREVMITSDINQALKRRLVMFEGGDGMIKNLPNFVTHLLIFFSPNLGVLDNFKVNLDLKLLNLGTIDGNFYGWFKRSDTNCNLF
ncbi:bifunctional diaminohydroxyphosphoribosylaminopyrimidine deaminase/5-amino-6-(5-phosphoribosylamino)uracil reductase RibD [Campylobacter corcagiensis]|uniref:Bifunctional diaminohydroxyphosphoribosylaminopyrimidine deaminase/5-amino-6-(5-phosphoribosylamino)uracil reductase RibD n=1 Tax=Campylobacter corcagiensis TaxID=1448857 RepID=A0A7M1LG18_9BACT|nr:bifunctional diaminohydroxyphosphoribosylaminopyrimidine deaminase/5-amino-6-(5-phosphoribosylamino)uracil reductase RibD [Campylobacter corcagiensis]QKF64303.1 diaminohydroxyphosphoribosylaminopyrimidine deaminase / 5-amino-6-(5-phosphoribosylamino)uracil reductase [Campylobacter corcagiensis]QOQ87508.1 bifunctional diaminohydroxyphosphoribosylaminopyrimidine deaminase/5-amino-6-(5-phosphoribosylamino)uracil reductase RibD [Campylobacter corcagiensis]